jgi:hypothetical protein
LRHENEWGGGVSSVNDGAFGGSHCSCRAAQVHGAGVRENRIGPRDRIGQREVDLCYGGTVSDRTQRTLICGRERTVTSEPQKSSSAHVEKYRSRGRKLLKRVDRLGEDELSPVHK